MGDYYPAYVRMLDMPVPYEAGLRVVNALIDAGLLDPADHEPIELFDEWHSDRGPVLQLCEPQASNGLDQLLGSDLVDAFVAAAVPFTLFESTTPEAYAGRCLDWQPGWAEPRERVWDSSGPLLSSGAWDELRARCHGDGTTLRGELDAYFCEVFDEPEGDGPSDERCHAHGVTATVTRSGGSDGAPVVFVDTNEDLEGGFGSAGPRMRILLNDHPVHVGIEWEPPLEDDEAEPLAA